MKRDIHRNGPVARRAAAGISLMLAVCFSTAPANASSQNGLDPFTDIVNGAAGGEYTVRAGETARITLRFEDRTILPTPIGPLYYDRIFGVSITSVGVGAQANAPTIVESDCGFDPGTEPVEYLNKFACSVTFEVETKLSDAPYRDVTVTPISKRVRPFYIGPFFCGLACIEYEVARVVFPPKNDRGYE